LQERLARGFEQTRQLYDELKRSRVTEEKLEKVQKALYATMDPVVAFLATEGKLRFEKREISIMFTGLTDFTSYSDRNRPEVVLEELNRFRGLMEPIVDLFRGHIDKCMGDGVMVEFGAPVDYDRHALLAVLAGLRMQQKSKKLNLPWRMRIGIATGSTVVGMLGVRRQAYSAVGDRVNVAKRLEEICQPDKVYIDEPTFRAVEPFVVANKLRNLGYGRQSDLELLMRMVSMEERLSREGESAELLNELGKANFELHDATSAIRYFERAKVTVYEVTGLKDRWRDPAVIPPAIAAAYADAASHIEIPEEVVLAVEALDGAIGHCRVVALLSYALADRLKLNEDMKKTIMLAGYLQNLGKEAVPHHVLNRGGSLTVQESKLIEKYVHESVAACRRMGFVDPHLLEIVLHHHETWDGTGYPDGLLGENIPLGARITAVAEAYSALTSWRPYHEAWDTRVAMSDIRKGVQKGTYDPKVAEALLEILHPFDMSS
jgi:HD-GYP domain-containing protein (c-di-GMP phosphodiesterase class II)/class 3 adenylate cyclase